ncbi:sugar transferase [halophilic archaeon]|nr:sugar transferase [halophilic archaeon]
MEVAYLVASNKGGLPHYAAELANAVSKEVDVTVVKPAKEVSADLFNESVNVVNAFKPTELSVINIYNRDFHLRKNLEGMKSYNNIDVIHEIDPDILHVPTGLFPHVKFFMWLNKITESYPTVVTRHELLSSNPSLNEYARFPVLAQNTLNFFLPDVSVGHTVVHTEENKNTLIEKGQESEEVSVIPHGAYDMFTEYDYAEKETEKETIIFFGNIVPHKALGSLVEAVIKVSEDFPGVKLIIAGDGKIKEDVQQRIMDHQHNFEVHNRFIQNEEVGELFSRASIAAMPYKEQGGNKGHSGTLTIAYSFGVPAVTTTAGDFGRLVKEADAGLVVPPEDVDALAEALRRLLSDDQRRTKMAKNSKEMADKLSWDSIADQHLDMYKSVIGGE